MIFEAIFPSRFLLEEENKKEERKNKGRSF